MSEKCAIFHKARTLSCNILSALLFDKAKWKNMGSEWIFNGPSIFPTQWPIIESPFCQLRDAVANVSHYFNKWE